MMILEKRHLSQSLMRGVFFAFFCVAVLIFTSSELSAKSERCSVESPCLAKVRPAEFKSIKIFSKVDVGSLEGTAEELGLSRAELTEHVLTLFGDDFADMDLNDELLPFLVDEPQELGYIRFTIRTVEEDDPVILHVLLTAGNYAMMGGNLVILHMYDEDKLQLSSRENINKDVKQALEDMMEDLAVKFYGARRTPANFGPCDSAMALYGTWY
jgi:hypothetical protein